MPKATHCHFLVSLLLAGFSFATADAHAGAWTQSKGSGQLITTATHYTTETRYNNSGDRTSQPRYSKNELNFYGEYGAWDGITLGGSAFLTHADDSSDSRSAVADSEWFARFRVLQGTNYVVSIQPMVKLPSPMGDANDRPAIGSRNADAGLSLLAGTNFRLFGRDHYADASAGYRYRFGDPQDQVQLAGTVGISITDALTIMPQLFQTIRVDDSASAGFTQSPRDDYNLTTLQLSALYALNDRDSVQAGGFYNPAGNNVGAGGGVLIAYWKRF